MNPEQVKEIQRRLQAKQLYAGDIDGKIGPATQRALVLEQQMEPQKSDAEIQLERERLQATQSDKEATRQEQRESSSDPLLDTYVPFGGGAVAGYTIGELANRALFKGDEGKAAALKEIGEELGPTSKLTDSKINRARAYGASEAAKRVAPSSGMSRLASVLGRVTTYGVPAGIIYNEYNRYKQAGEDPTLTETERQANRRIANGLLGTLTGVGVEGGMRLANRVLPEGYGKSLARIETARNLAERFDDRDAVKSPSSSGMSRLARSVKGQPQSDVIEARPIQSLPSPKLPQSKPQAAVPKEQTPIRNMERLRSAASASGGRPATSKSANYETLRKNLTKDNLPDVAESMNMPKSASKSAVLQRARELLRTSGKSGLLLPMTAAGIAYELAGEPAEAGTGNQAGTDTSTADRLGAAAAAGGTVYGMDRLMNALKSVAPTLVKSVGAGSVMTLPDAIGSQFDDYTDDELTAGSNKLYNQQARFQEATGLPDWIMGQNVAEAREMAQVPEPNPARVYENAYAPSGQPSGYGGDGGGTHVMPDGSVMADNEMQEQPAQAQPEQPPAEDGDFAALSQALEQDPEIADLLREYIRSRIDPAQYQ